MVNKKVTCYSVNIPESMDFVQLLLDNEESSLKPFVLDQYRTIELKYTQIQKNGSIVGLFVTTSRKNIPPAHKPGNGDDYTALPLDDGQGLAYPNVFLYDPQFKVLYLETNRMGVSPSKICAYFEARAIRDSIPTFWIEISPLLKKEAYERVENMVRIKYVNLKLAKPTGLLRNNLSKGSLRGLASISDQLNADKYMQELEKTKTRGLTTFYFNDRDNKDFQEYEGKQYNPNFEFGGKVVETVNGKTSVEIKNKLSVGDEMEIIIPGKIEVVKFTIEKLWDYETDEEIETINPGVKDQKVKMQLPIEVKEGWILRRKK